MSDDGHDWLWIMAVLAVLLYLVADRITILGLGEAQARSLGLGYAQTRALGLVIVSLLTALVLEMVGAFPFVGLVAPNLISRWRGDNLRANLALIAVFGGALDLAADVIGRFIPYPFEFPAATVFAALGAVILRSVDLTLDAGGITALIGPNGAGKSSLLHCIAGLNRLTSGTVRIGDLDPFAAPGSVRARAVALLQQSPAVVSRLRVRDLVALGRWPHHRGRATPHDDAVVTQALDAFALEALADHPVETLSGGQRERASIAITWAQDTPWMLLDEPINALDPSHARDLMARLHDLSRAGGRGVVIVLHDINAAAGWADKIVAMKDDRVVAQDTSVALLTPETLGAVFDTSFEVLNTRGRPVVVTS